jgi:ferritin
MALQKIPRPTVFSTKAPVTSEPMITGIKTAPIAGRNPMIDDSCISFLNYRVQQEDQSSRIYLSMSLWLDNNGYVNAAKLWKKYSDEERGHADIARTYLLNMGVQPATPSLEQPSEVYTGLPDIIRQSFDHEVEITRQCSDLAKHALTDGSHMLYELALHYLKEQNEEHGKMQNWVDQLNAFGEDKIAMRLLDHEIKDYL